MIEMPPTARFNGRASTTTIARAGARVLHLAEQRGQREQHEGREGRGLAFRALADHHDGAADPSHAAVRVLLHRAQALRRGAELLPGPAEVACRRRACELELKAFLVQTRLDVAAEAAEAADAERAFSGAR
ncbi:MAG: hypothetical protein ACKVWR_18145 [Acidimicrobiales bacterium]